MPALKEPQRITLPEALTILERDLPTEQGKLRLRQAFIQKAFRQEPLFALSYDEADIDWTTGSVKIPRKRDRFCPTFLRSDFNACFFVDDIAAPVGAEGVHLKRDPDLIQKLLLKLDNYPSKQGDMFVFRGEEPELAVEGYTSEQITYHLEQLKKMGLIDSPGSQPMLGVTFRGLSPRGRAVQFSLLEVQANR
jgi:hypothetical protein